MKHDAMIHINMDMERFRTLTKNPYLRLLYYCASVEAGVNPQVNTYSAGQHLLERALVVVHEHVDRRLQYQSRHYSGTGHSNNPSSYRDDYISSIHRVSHRFCQS